MIPEKIFHAALKILFIYRTDFFFNLNVAKGSKKEDYWMKIPRTL